LDDVAPRKLSPQQILFIDEYIRTSNATAAYIFAYYTKQGRPEPEKKSAVSVKASQLLINPKITAEIQKVIKKNNKSNNIANPVELLEGYTRAIRFDPGELVDKETGEFLPVHKLPEYIRLELAGMDYSEHIVEKTDGTEQHRTCKVKYKFPEKNRVRDSLCKIFNIGQDGNGLKTLLIEMLQQQFGMNITVNQTFNDNRQQIVYNPSLIKPLPGLDGTGPARQ
jgi:phage terminase small subunit